MWVGRRRRAARTRRAVGAGTIAAATPAWHGQPVAEVRVGTRYRVKQRMIALGDDFLIENESGEKVVKVSGRLLRARDTLAIESPEGEELYTIAVRALNVRETMDITHPDGSTAAVIHNALLSPLRDRWRIEVPGGTLTAAGSILQHEYVTRDGDRPLALVSKKWLRLRDSFGVEVADSADVPLMLAITIVIDALSHSGGRNGSARGSRLDVP